MRTACIFPSSPAAAPNCGNADLSGQVSVRGARGGKFEIEDRTVGQGIKDSAMDRECLFTALVFAALGRGKWHA
jgi:hypothetical protein